MKIDIVPFRDSTGLEIITIQEFAKRYNLTMRVVEEVDRNSPKGEYATAFVAYFPDVTCAMGPISSMTLKGRARSVDDAITVYCIKLSKLPLRCRFSDIGAFEFKQYEPEES